MRDEETQHLDAIILSQTGPLPVAVETVIARVLHMRGNAAERDLISSRISALIEEEKLDIESDVEHPAFGEIALSSAPLDSTTIDALFALALAQIDEDGKSNGGDRTDNLSRRTWGGNDFRRLGSRDVLEKCKVFCTSASPQERRVGAVVLGRMNYDVEREESLAFPEERFQVLHDLLQAEVAGPADPKVVEEACSALGLLNDPRAIPEIAKLCHHPHPDVRLGVARGLSEYKNDPAIAVLIKLSSDSDDWIRTWVAFALGKWIDLDIPAIRSALHALLNDPYEFARDGAFESLVRCKDPKAKEWLIEVLKTGEPSLKFLSAAASFADPALCEALKVAEQNGLEYWDEDGEHWNVRSDWERAMEACGCQEDAR